MTTMRKDECHEITAIIQSSLAPIVNKLQGLEEKVDKLMQDRVTRSDMETRFKELTSIYVPRDLYEPHHTTSIERVNRLENDLRELHNRIEKKFEAIEEAALTEKDRTWLRIGQISGWIALALTLLPLLAHIRFQ